MLPVDPCLPSPCGPNSQCRDVGGTPSCSCATSFVGRPPNCRPECTANTDCVNNRACINFKCIDPCIGSCGLNTECSVVNHIPMCTCLYGYIGDPFSACNPKPPGTSKLSWWNRNYCSYRCINALIYIIFQNLHKWPTLVIHLRAVPMQNVIEVFAPVYRNTTGTRTRVADRNAYSVLTARPTAPVCVLNA